MRRRNTHSRTQRWNDAVTALGKLQAAYTAWLEALPDNQQGSATAEALQTIVDLDLTELQTIEPPRGFGHD
ncbi:MAG: hypothetical protein H7251_01230 [Acetobacteraceae bacterium]|nr:hypothetical protein [Acetobacteraceae bacterium]